MAYETDKGFFKEYQRTPEEEKMVMMEREIKTLKERVSKLEEIVILFGKRK